MPECPDSLYDKSHGDVLVGVATKPTYKIAHIEVKEYEKSHEAICLGGRN